MGDIDHFKTINDTYGHLVGDAVLTEMSRILRKHCRQSDIPARWGGEEFAILLPNTDISGGQALAERIRQAITTHPFEHGHHITVSFGVATLTHDDGRDLVRRADAALYTAKQTGRNTVVSDT
jgi:diguanylate cyclase (GGDEF)-like protein